MTTPQLVFRNATIVDGTGAAAFTGDVAVTDGRISAVGQVDASGAQEIDATGRVLAPGFIDIHTHFDPQICWDRLATPSLEHGVTSVVMGNCSLSLAPVRPGKSQKIISMFQVIEDIKQATFDEAVPFSWESVPEYLDHIRDGLGINVGLLLGHSAIRYYVMDAASQERVATDDELAQMCAIVEEGMAAGAMGISSSYVDMDENMHPVPSRFADLREKVALAQAMMKSGRGVWQVVPYFPDPAEQIKNIQELGEISLASGAVCSFQPLLVTPGLPSGVESIRELEAQRERGARVYAQVMPRPFDMNMRLAETSMLLFALPQWKSIMDRPFAERVESFSDPATRKALVEEMAAAQGMSLALPFLTVGEVRSEQNQKYRGKSLLEIAGEEGKQLGEVILDISLADDLQAEFQLKGVLNADRAAVGELLAHDLVHFGASDAGAHITQFCGTGDTSFMLQHYVRETGQIPLETAIFHMTGELARDWGISDRGRIEVGLAADLVLFDPERVGCSSEIFRNDFPGEANRYIREATGYEAVVVNGEIVVRSGEYTEARAGVVI